MIRLFSQCIVLAMGMVFPLAASAQTLPTSPTQLAQILRESPDNHAARWAFAQAAFQAERYDLARYHLRQLLRAARSERDIATFTKALAEIDARDPWDVTFNFSFLPSTNVRRSTFNETFETNLGVFIPSGGGDEESGVGIAFGAQLAYAMSVSDRSRLNLRVNIDRTQYEDRDLTRTWVRFGAQQYFYRVGGTTIVEPFLRFRFDTDGQEERRHLGVTASRDWWLGHNNAVTASVTFEDVNNLETPTLSGPSTRVGLQYGFAVDGQTQARISAQIERFIPDLQYQAYSGVRVGGDLTRSFDGIGRIGAFASYRIRDFDDVFPFTSIVREDRTVVIGMSFSPSTVEVFGTRPRMSCQNERNASNIALYDYRSFDCRLTFERSF